MKIVFFGSSPFAGPSLRALLSSRHEVSAIVTQPDKRQGRGLRLGGTAIKEIARSWAREVFQPVSVNDQPSVDFLRGLSADIFVIIAYGQRFSQRVLDIPRVLPLNVHASQLPRYRGAAPINWAIINGDRQTGNTIMKVVLRMDAGPIIAQSTLAIEPEDTALTLQEKLAADAAGLLLDAIQSLQQGSATLTDQDESRVTIAPKLDPEHTRIKWDTSALEIHNLVRGCLGWSSAYTRFNGKILKVYRSRLGSNRGHVSEPPGQIVDITEDALFVATAEGVLAIEELQLEGKNRLGAAQFCRGVRLCVGQRLG